MSRGGGSSKELNDASRCVERCLRFVGWCERIDCTELSMTRRARLAFGGDEVDGSLFLVNADRARLNIIC